jgi:myo-inositol-1(or 4)-monophosphatase
VTDEELLDVLRAAAGAVGAALAGVRDWGETGHQPGQHHSDLVADAAAVELLLGHGVGVLSEESGPHAEDRATTVVVDPLDGSTNASRGVSWWATSLCAVDAQGLRVAHVVDRRHGTVWEAVRGGGAWRDGEPVAPSTCRRAADAIVGVNGWPRRRGPWRQYRALGAAALDLCAVADGTLDAYVDCTTDEHAPWDYLAGVLVCQEAGAVVVDAWDRDLVALDHRARRTPVAACRRTVLDELRPWAGGGDDFDPTVDP